MRAIPLVLALLLAAGCAMGEVARQAGENPPELVGGESEADVKRRWGPPDRTMTARDEPTGKQDDYWIYERFVDANGSTVITTLTFQGGKMTRVERTPKPQGVGPVPDRAARRDME